MKNHRDTLGIFLNILVVVLILVFIVLGLNKIGVYDLPDSIEKLVGTYEEDEKASLGKADLSSSIKFGGKETVSSTETKVNNETARNYLAKITPANNYKHELTVQNFAYDGSVIDTQNILVESSNSSVKATLKDSFGNTVKTVEERKNETVITKFTANTGEKITVNKGNFDISDEIGFILTADNFLKSDLELDEASFTLSESENGAEITIIFDTVMNDYSQKEKYTVNLDFGVVTSADCYENGNLVYSMKTKSLVFDKNS